MPWVIDYANDRPDLHAAKQAGCIAIARYLSMFTDTGKNIDRPEIQTCAALDLGIVLVYEDDGGALGGGPAQGYQRGVTDRARAEGQANAIGFPADRPIYMAVDTDSLDPTVVAGYFHGVASVASRPVGGYGQPQLMDHLADAGLIDWLWCTAAWSGGYRSPRAHLFQRIGKTYARDLAGDFDENDPMQSDFGQWNPAGGSPTTGGLTMSDVQTILSRLDTLSADIEARDNHIEAVLGSQADRNTAAIVGNDNDRANEIKQGLMVGVANILDHLTPQQATSAVAHLGDVATLAGFPAGTSHADIATLAAAATAPPPKATTTKKAAS